MNVLAPVGAKLALIVPRLGSPHDGEVVASARAIERTLKGAGLDWHNLSAVIAAGGAEPPEPRYSTTAEAPPPLWAELGHSGRAAWIGAIASRAWLSPWEQDFVSSVIVQINRQPFRSLSAKQQIILNRLISRAFQCGARP